MPLSTRGIENLGETYFGGTSVTSRKLQGHIFEIHAAYEVLYGILYSRATPCQETKPTQETTQTQPYSTAQPFSFSPSTSSSIHFFQTKIIPYHLPPSYNSISNSTAVGLVETSIDQLNFKN